MRYALLFVLALAIAGCGTVKTATEAQGETFGASGKAASKAFGGFDLSGTYKGEIELPTSGKDDMGAALAKGMGDMLAGMMTLEFPSDGKFKLAMMGIPVEGTATIRGSEITLTPETVMGMTPEEAKKLDKEGASMDKDMKPMKGEILDGGAIIRLLEEGKSDKEGVMVFKRAAAEKKESVDKTSGDSEKRLVGEWKGEVELGPSASDEDKMMAKALKDSFKLRLDADRTFTMNMMVEIIGEWTLSGDTISLQPTKMMGMEMSAEERKSNEPMVGKVSGDGRSIVVTKQGETEKLTFKKQ